MSNRLALPIAPLVQSELEESNQVEVVLLQEAFLDLSQAHAFNFSQSSRTVSVHLRAETFELFLQPVLIVFIFDLVTALRAVFFIENFAVHLKLIIQLRLFFALPVLVEFIILLCTDSGWIGSLGHATMHWLRVRLI